MDEVGVSDGLFDFVGLQVADVVPTDRLSAEMLGFGIHLLHPVFTKVQLSRIQRRLEEFNGFGFAHSDERDVLGQGGFELIQPIGNRRNFGHWISWINNPLRSFGSIHVLLGGKKPPRSAVCISCSGVTECNSNRACPG